MKKRSILTVEVDSQGRFVLPGEVGKRYGFTAGAKVRLGATLPEVLANLRRLKELRVIPPFHQTLSRQRIAE